MSNAPKQLHEAPASMLKFSGTPTEIGTQIAERMCLPAIKTVSQARGGDDLVALYSGLFCSLAGYMAADFGVEVAADLLQHLVDGVRGAAADIKDATH